MWRKAGRKTLDRFHDADADDLSIAFITGAFVTDMEAVRVEVRRMRRSLRDLRDSRSEKRASWHDVQFAGLVDLMPVGGDGGFVVRPVARLLLNHSGIPQTSVERVMRDWFSGSGRDGDVGPYREDAFLGSPPGAGFQMPWRAVVGATLFQWHRGAEPLRVAVGPQGCPLPLIASAGEGGSPKRAWLEPMPVAFG